MKQGWEIKKLGEVCDIICGQDYKSVKDDNGKYPIYGTGGIMDMRLSIDVQQIVLSSVGKAVLIIHCL